VHRRPANGSWRPETLRDAEHGISETDCVITIESAAESELPVKGSRFLSYASPVKDREAAEAFIRTVSKKHHDATHVCYAYRIGWGDSSQFRYSDAGEPSGTAGKPILEAMDRRGIQSVVCVVVRYFGGVKLGTGGLSRAYAQSASSVLEKAHKVKRWNTQLEEAVFSYEWTGTVRLLLAKHDCTIEDTTFDQRTKILFRVRTSRHERLRQELLDMTRGNVHVRIVPREEQRGI
jgi:uncharacterized YigZ family protein